MLWPFQTIRRGSNLSGNPSYQIKPDGTARSNYFRVRQNLSRVYRRQRVHGLRSRRAYDRKPPLASTTAHRKRGHITD